LAFGLWLVRTFLAGGERSNAAVGTTPEDPDINPAGMEYIVPFVPKASGKNRNAHVSVGVATRDYLDRMLTEPFEAFTLSPVGVSVYHLGNFGNGPGKLKALDLKP